MRLEQDNPYKIAYIIGLKDIKTSMIFSTSTSTYADREALDIAHKTYRDERTENGLKIFNWKLNTPVIPIEEDESEWEIEEEITSADTLEPVCKRASHLGAASSSSTQTSSAATVVQDSVDVKEAKKKEKQAALNFYQALIQNKSMDITRVNRTLA